MTKQRTDKSSSNLSPSSESLSTHSLAAQAKIIQRGSLDFVQINHPTCVAEVSLFGGHITHWQPTNHKPILWMSKNTALDGKTALRGGIPICWPWFGPVQGKGRHGLVRTKLWQLDAYRESRNTVEIILSVELSAAENPWPHPQRLEMEISFGAALQQTLRMKNDGDNPLCFAFALHNYFEISGLDNIEIPFLANQIYDDTLSGAKHVLDTQSSVNSEKGAYQSPFDRVYLNQDEGCIIDKKYGRRIVIEKFGSQHWVLWNPGADAAVTMTDVDKGGERNFVCLEVANTTDIVIAPGGTASVGQTISVESL